jgi:hypothetical protein
MTVMTTMVEMMIGLGVKGRLSGGEQRRGGGKERYI